MADGFVQEEGYGAIKRDVEALYEERSDHWRKLLKNLRLRFDEYAATPALDTAIYRVYARDDKQGGGPHSHLKAAHKVADEVFLQRNGGTKVRGGKKATVTANPSFRIYDVTDILGLTIVCPFPSDVDRVVKQIREDAKAGRFTLQTIKEHTRSEYSAIHLQLAIEEDPFEFLVCEVQIKTAFQDAFGWKTHGIAYKADSRTDGWFLEQLRRIMVVIRTADEMSDQLRDRIVRETAHGRERREQARLQLKANICDHAPSIPDASKREDVQVLLAQLDACSTAVYGPQRTDPYAPLKQGIDALILTHGYDAHTFRVASLYAVDCRRRDQLFWLQQHYDAWTRPLALTAGSNDLETFYRATAIYAVAVYCLGDLDRAIRLSEAALARLSGIASPWVGRMASNLAYFYAEAYGAKPDKDLAKKAKDTWARAEGLMGASCPAADKDTKGYVLIQTGQSVDEVEEGLELCREAFRLLDGKQQKVEEIAVAKHFFELHREIAYRRLADMMQASLQSPSTPAS